MARAAVIGRAKRRRGGAPALAFDVLPGALVAFCGLAGGVGTTTLAYLFARSAAASGAREVLLCEADPNEGALVLLARRRSERALVEIARAPDAGGPTVLGRRLKMIAAAPLETEAEPEAVAELLRSARGAHRLVVVDCGRLGGPHGASGLVAATSIVWVVGASPQGAAKAQATLASPWRLPGGAAARQTLAAVRRSPGASPCGRALRAAAAPGCHTLVQVPYLASLERSVIAPNAAREAALALEALGAVARREAR